MGDIVLTGNCITTLNRFIDTLSKRFSIKDMGTLHQFLGIEVISTPKGLFLSQHHHITDILTRFHMEGEKEVATPLSSTETLVANDGSTHVDPTEYQKVLGSIVTTQKIWIKQSLDHNPIQVKSPCNLAEISS